MRIGRELSKLSKYLFPHNYFFDNIYHDGNTISVLCWDRCPSACGWAVRFQNNGIILFTLDGFDPPIPRLG